MKRKRTKLLALILAATMAAFLFAEINAEKPSKLISRFITSGNLLLNPGMSGNGNWNGGTVNAQSHDGVGGSLGLTGAAAGCTPAQCIHQTVPVVVGQSYVLSWWQRSNVNPGGNVDVYFETLDASGTPVDVDPRTGPTQVKTQYELKIYGTTTANTWQEHYAVATIQPGVGKVRIVFSRYDAGPTYTGPLGVGQRRNSFFRQSDWTASNPGTIFIDDVLFTPGDESRSVTEAQAAAAKVAFNPVGASTTMSAYGAFQKRFSGTWVDKFGATHTNSGNLEPFFPMCMYGVNQSISVTRYRNWSYQGINCEGAHGGFVSVLTTLKQAGMVGSYDLNNYVGYPPDLVGGDPTQDGFCSNSCYGNTSLSLASSTPAAIRAAGLNDTLLWAYWDNEADYGGYAAEQNVTNAWRNLDCAPVNCSLGGTRQHPIWRLEGSIGLGTTYYDPVNGSWADATGTYTPGADNPYPGAIEGTGYQGMLDKQPGNRIPAAVCQINIGIGSGWRARLYACLAHGAHGAAYWTDGALGLPLIETQTDVWNQIGEFMGPFGRVGNNSPMDKLMPILDTPHLNVGWSTSVVSAGQSPTVRNEVWPVDHGERIYNGEGYVIVSNVSGVAKTATFTINPGLSYTPTTVVNFLTGATVTTVTGGQFTVNLAPTGTAGDVAVYRLVGSGPPPTTGAPTTAGPILYSLGNRVWDDANNDGIIQNSEPGLAGATVQLLGPTAAVLTSTTSDAFGYYLFTGLAAGQYRVKVIAPAGKVSSSIDSLNPDDDVDAYPTGPSDNGIGTGNTATSNIITLLGPEPSGEIDVVGGQGGPDNLGNMTLDFGFRTGTVTPTTLVGPRCYRKRSRGGGRLCR
jgi:SdrD B-like domain